MKIKFVLLIVLILTGGSLGIAQPKAVGSGGETVKRQTGETAAAFAERNKPAESELTHKIVETEVWGNQKTILAFYDLKAADSAGETSEQVAGYLFMPVAPDLYRKVLIKNFEPEGGTPKIEAVFFANADRDQAKELIVICSWQQQHYDVSGTLYNTFVFDDVKPGANPAALDFLEKISDKVSGGCDCDYRDGTKGNKKFKTAAQVKAGLQKLGF